MYTLDCSEIADNLNCTFKGGYILEITSLKKGKTILGIEYGKTENFSYPLGIGCAYVEVLEWLRHKTEHE